jgi:hypothetical protein
VFCVFTFSVRQQQATRLWTAQGSGSAVTNGRYGAKCTNGRGGILALHRLYLASFPAVPHCQGRFSPHCPNNHRISKPCMCSCSVILCTSGHHRRRPEHCNAQFSTSFGEQFVSQSKAHTAPLYTQTKAYILGK